MHTASTWLMMTFHYWSQNPTITVHRTRINVWEPVYVFLKKTRRSGTLVEEESWPLGHRVVADSKRKWLPSRLPGITRQVAIKITSFTKENDCDMITHRYGYLRTSNSIVFQLFCSINNIQIAGNTFGNLPQSTAWPISTGISLLCWLLIPSSWQLSRNGKLSK